MIGKVTFTRGSWVTLSVIGSSNKILARVSGHTPLQLRRRLGAGVYWFGVATAERTRVSYALTVVARP